jgi:hypothetical protein
MHSVMVCVSRIVCGRVDDFLLLGGRRLDAGGAAAGGQLGSVKGMRVEIQRQDVRRCLLHVAVWCERDGICAATTRRLWFSDVYRFLICLTAGTWGCGLNQT